METNEQISDKLENINVTSRDYFQVEFFKGKLVLK